MSWRCTRESSLFCKPSDGYALFLPRTVIELPNILRNVNPLINTP